MGGPEDDDGGGQGRRPTEGPDEDPVWVARVRQQLLAWYRRGHRDLPWRESRDPYEILVSEMMLVQTTVAAVLPYYRRFLGRFPTVGALAAAEEADVLKAWEGLGYYRRARQLHDAARAIVREHGGSIPDDLEAIRTLPGVGRYIAGALLSFAFDRPVPIVEANTRRVLARWLAWDQELGKATSEARLWRAAERLVPVTGAGQFNQAFMELGAQVCTPRTPSCLVCPVASECRARARGLQDALPVKPPRSRPLDVVESCALVSRDDGDFLIVRRATSGLWAGFWEFPTIHISGADPAGRSLDGPVDLAEGVRRLTGIRARIGPPTQVVRFGVTRHRVELTAYAAAALDGEPSPGPGLDRVAWVPPRGLSDHVFSSAGRRLVAWLAGGPGRRDWPVAGGPPSGDEGPC